MVKIFASVVVLVLLVSTISGLPVDDKNPGPHPVQTQSSNHNVGSNQQQPLTPSHQQQPHGSLHASTSKPGRKTRDTASQEDTPPSLLGSQSSTTTENSESSHLSSSSTSTDSRRVREAENTYSHEGGRSVYDNTRPQTGQSGSPYDKAQSLGNSGYQGSHQSSQSNSDYGSVHPLGSSSSSQSGQSTYSHAGTGVSSSTEQSSNPYANRNY